MKYQIRIEGHLSLPVARVAAWKRARVRPADHDDWEGDLDIVDEESQAAESVAVLLERYAAWGEADEGETITLTVKGGAVDMTGSLWNAMYVEMGVTIASLFRSAALFGGDGDLDFLDGPDIRYHVHVGDGRSQLLPDGKPAKSNSKTKGTVKAPAKAAAKSKPAAAKLSAEALDLKLANLSLAEPDGRAEKVVERYLADGAALDLPPETVQKMLSVYAEQGKGSLPLIERVLARYEHELDHAGKWLRTDEELAAELVRCMANAGVPERALEFLARFRERKGRFTLRLCDARNLTLLKQQEVPAEVLRAALDETDQQVASDVKRVGYLKAPVVLHTAACVAARLGDRARMLGYVKHAKKIGYSELASMRSDSDLKAYWKDDDFRALFR